MTSLRPYSLSSLAPGWETAEKSFLAVGVSLLSSSSGVGGLQLDNTRWASASASLFAWFIWLYKFISSSTELQQTHLGLFYIWQKLEQAKASSTCFKTRTTLISLDLLSNLFAAYFSRFNCSFNETNCSGNCAGVYWENIQVCVWIYNTYFCS